jgi:single-strand DNA-binding protein
MYNHVQLIGRLGRDPEVRYTTDGTAVASFSVATDESWKDKSGEKHTETEWHNCVAWRKLGEICGEYLKKGSLVFVEGKLKSREYEAKEGGKKKVWEVVLSGMKMLGDKPQGDGQQRTERKPPAGRDSDFIPELDEDIPM